MKKAAMAAATPCAEDILGAMALISVTKVAWELRLPQIMAGGGPEGMSVAEIAAKLRRKPSDSSGGDGERYAEALRRILRFLESHNLVRSNKSNETLYYSLPPAAVGEGVNEEEEEEEDVWGCVGPYAAFVLHPFIRSKWDELPERLLADYGSAAAAGRPDFYEAMDGDPVFRQVFVEAMASLTSEYIRALCGRRRSKWYDMDPERKARTLVDVGGGSGQFAASIARTYPHLTRVINFDLPHVIAAAPTHSGVEHIQGDMFQSVPSADIIFMKSVLHNWSDYDCVRILRNCHKSLTGSSKLVILDVVHENDMIDQNNISTTRAKLALDTIMLALFATTEGKERNKNEWGIILKDANFQNYKFIEIQESRSLFSIIEATIE